MGCSQIWNTNLCISVVTIIYSRKIFYIFLSSSACSLKLLFLCSLGITNGTSSIISKHMLLTYFSTGELLNNLHINIWHNLLTGQDLHYHLETASSVAAGNNYELEGTHRKYSGGFAVHFLGGVSERKFVTNWSYTFYLPCIYAPYGIFEKCPTIFCQS